MRRPPLLAPLLAMLLGGVVLQLGYNYRLISSVLSPLVSSPPHQYPDETRGAHDPSTARRDHGPISQLEFASETSTFQRLLKTYEESLGCGKKRKIEAKRGDEERQLGVFGTVDEIEHEACLFASVTQEVPPRDQAPLWKRRGHRLPFFTSDATRFFRCNALKHVGVALIEAHYLKKKKTTSDKSDASDEGEKKAHLDALENANKVCHERGEADEMTYALASAFSSPPMSVTELSALLRAAMRNTPRGRNWTDTIQRAARLASPLRPSRVFQLSETNRAWSSQLPSFTQAFVNWDINSHVAQLPSPVFSTFLAKNALVESLTGRVIVANADLTRLETFYPRRAAWSHVELMESFAFHPHFVEVTPPDSFLVESRPVYLRDAHARSRFLRHHTDSDAREMWEACSAAAGKLLNESRFGETIPCGSRNGKRKALAVARALTVTQKLSNQMFHFLCESFPRLGLHLAWLSPDFHLHVDCRKHTGYCDTLIEALGVVPSGQVTGFPLQTGALFAGELVVPEGGRKHWPLSQYWSMEAIRRRTLMTMGVDAESCFASSASPPRVLVMKRKMTRLNPFHAWWYDVLAGLLRVDPALALSLGPAGSRVAVELYDDADGELMRDGRRQVAKMRSADVILGAHGAGLSLLAYAKRCAHAVSVRGRYNSDIYEHLALAMGIGFHHITFRYALAPLYRDARAGVIDALRVMMRRDDAVRITALGAVEGASLKVLEEGNSEVEIVTVTRVTDMCVEFPTRFEGRHVAYFPRGVEIEVSWNGLTEWISDSIEFGELLFVDGREKRVFGWVGKAGKGGRACVPIGLVEAMRRGDEDKSVRIDIMPLVFERKQSNRDGEILRRGGWLLIPDEEEGREDRDPYALTAVVVSTTTGQIEKETTSWTSSVKNAPPEIGRDDGPMPTSTSFVSVLGRPRLTNTTWYLRNLDDRTFRVPASFGKKRGEEEEDGLDFMLHPYKGRRRLLPFVVWY